jgi:hypothetical protein
MFGRLFSNRPRVDSVAAQISIDLINRNRLNANYGESVSRQIPVVYATNWEFMGTLTGMVESCVISMGDNTPVKEALAQVLVGLFGDNAQKAYATVTAGVDSDAFMAAFENIQRHLEWVGTLNENDRSRHLRFMEKYF